MVREEGPRAKLLLDYLIQTVFLRPKAFPIHGYLKGDLD